MPEVSRTYSITALFGGPVNTGTQNIYLKEPHERAAHRRSRSSSRSRAGSAASRRSRVFPAQPPTIGERFGGQPLQYVLQAPNLEEMLKVLPKFLEEAQKRPELRFVDSDLKVNREEAPVRIDREKAAELGVSALDVARTLQLTFGDQRFGYFVMNGKQYQVIGQLDRAFRNEPERPEERVRARRATAQARIARQPRHLGRARRCPPRSTASIATSRRPSRAAWRRATRSATAFASLDEVAKQTLPPTFNTTLAGQARDFARQLVEPGRSPSALALLIVYLVLAAQFESFIDPIIILLTVPLARERRRAGALAHRLVAQHLQPDRHHHAGRPRDEERHPDRRVRQPTARRRRSRLDAALEAASERFRPILMTSLATMLGVLPIALSLGAASGSRQSLGIAVVGGLLGATFLSLFLVPALYSFLSPSRRKARGALQSGSGAEALPATAE